MRSRMPSYMVTESQNITRRFVLFDHDAFPCAFPVTGATVTIDHYGQGNFPVAFSGFGQKEAPAAWNASTGATCP